MPTSIGAGEGKLNLVVRPGYAERRLGQGVPGRDGLHRHLAGRHHVGRDRAADAHAAQYDGVSAPGDASTRLVLAGDAAPVNVDLIRSYPDLSGFLKDQPDNTYEGTPLRHPARLGRGPADVAARRGAAGSRLLGRRVRPGLALPRAGDRARRPAHDRRRGAVPEGDRARSRHHRRLRADGRSSSRPPSTSRRCRAAWSGTTGADSADLVPRVGHRRRRGRASAWQGAANAVSDGPAANEPVTAIVPKEGSTGWTTTWMVYAKARNPNCMYLWMDFITRPAVQAQVAHGARRGAGQPEGLRRDRERPIRTSAAPSTSATRRSPDGSRSRRCRLPTAATIAAPRARGTTPGARRGRRSTPADALQLAHVPDVGEHVAERVGVARVDRRRARADDQPRPEMRGSTAGRPPTVAAPASSTTNSLSISDVATKRLPAPAWPRAAMHGQARRVPGAAGRAVDAAREHGRAAQPARRRIVVAGQHHVGDEVDLGHLGVLHRDRVAGRARRSPVPASTTSRALIARSGAGRAGPRRPARSSSRRRRRRRRRSP